MTLKLNDVVNAFDATDDVTTYFYNKKTGELKERIDSSDGILSDDDFDENGVDEIYKHFEDYLALPDRFDINDYHIMEMFVDSLPTGDEQDQLVTAIHGRGAFRSFRETIARFGIEQKWYDYRWDALTEQAIDWLRFYDIPYDESKE